MDIHYIVTSRDDFRSGNFIVDNPYLLIADNFNKNLINGTNVTDTTNRIIPREVDIIHFFG